MIAPLRPLGDFLACLTGPAIWALHFFVVYGAETVVCLASSSPTHAMRWTAIAATTIALVAIFLTMRRFPENAGTADGTMRDFLRSVALVLAALSAAAIVATTLFAFRLPACLSPAG